MSERNDPTDGSEEEGAYSGLGGAWRQTADPSDTNSGAGDLKQSGSGGVGGSLGEAAESPLGAPVDTSGSEGMSREDTLDMALGGTPGDLGTGVPGADTDDLDDASVQR